MSTGFGGQAKKSIREPKGCQEGADIQGSGRRKYPLSLQARVADLCAKPPKKATAKRVARGVEGQQDDSKNKTVAKRITVAKEAATPSRKRKAGEELKEDSAAVRDVAKEATSNIYKKRKVEAKSKAHAVANTKPIESEARVSLAKKRRTKDEHVVETEPVEEKMTVSSAEKKAINVKDDEVFDPQDIHTRVAHMYS